MLLHRNRVYKVRTHFTLHSVQYRLRPSLHYSTLTVTILGHSVTVHHALAVTFLGPVVVTHFK